ncbi:MAG: hypothetical protein ACH254_20210 [Candidatus Thiodiazotropha endolucinida]
MSDNTEREYLWEKRHEVLYRVELSALYHRKRERYFDTLDRVIKAIAIIGGSAALSDVGGDSVVKIAAITITVTSTLSLVFDLSGRARRHADLAHEYSLIEKEIMEKGERDYSEEDTKQWAARTRNIESDEPPVNDKLIQLCQNQLARARGKEEYIEPMGIFQWIKAYFY